MERVNDMQASGPETEGLRDRKKRIARDAMHRAALELVVEYGTVQVTVDQIAERAGVSPRTLFNYWGSKEAVILGIVPSDCEELVSFLQERPEEEEPSASMRALLELHIQHGTPDQSIRSLRRDVLRREPHLTQTLANQTSDVQRELIDVLAARLTPQMGPEDAHDAACMHVFWVFGMSRAAYAISMQRNIDLTAALRILLAHLDSGTVTLHPVQ